MSHFKMATIKWWKFLLAAGAHQAILWNDQLTLQMARQPSYIQMITLLSQPLPQSIISGFLCRRSELIIRLLRLKKQYQSKQQQTASATQLLSFTVMPYSSVELLTARDPPAIYPQL